jgi:hypothetical protein
MLVTRELANWLISGLVNWEVGESGYQESRKSGE